MEHALKDISFEEWVVHVFDHEARDQQAARYFDRDSGYWDGPPDVTIADITHLFEDSIPYYLQQYSDEQLNLGFWYSGAQYRQRAYVCPLLNEIVSIEARKRCVRPFIRYLSGSSTQLAFAFALPISPPKSYHLNPMVDDIPPPFLLYSKHRDVILGNAKRI